MLSIYHDHPSHPMQGMLSSLSCDRGLWMSLAVSGSSLDLMTGSRRKFHRTIPEDLCCSESANDGAINMWTNLKVGEIFRNHVLISSIGQHQIHKPIARSLKSPPSFAQLTGPSWALPRTGSWLRAQEATSHRPWDALRSRWEWRFVFFSVVPLPSQVKCHEMSMKCHETEILATYWNTMKYSCRAKKTPEQFQVFTSCPDSRPGRFQNTSNA